MEIVLIRHGEPEWVRSGLSVDDPPLTTRGCQQAEAMAAALSREQFDEVLVSPLQRARQTAIPLLRALERPEVLEPWLEEIGNPVWHGTPAEKAEEVFKAERSKQAPQRWDGLPGGESVKSFTERIHRGLTGFLTERGISRGRTDFPIWHLPADSRRIAIVAHAGTNAVVISHLLGLQPVPWEWDRFVLGHASVSRLEALPVGDGHTFSLTRLGDVEHLQASDRTR